MPLVTSSLTQMTSASVSTANGKKYKTTQVSTYKPAPLVTSYLQPRRDDDEPSARQPVDTSLYKLKSVLFCFLKKVLKPPYHSFEARTCSPFKQRGLHPTTLQGECGREGHGPAGWGLGVPHVHLFTQTHTEPQCPPHTICCAKHLESQSEGACHNSERQGGEQNPTDLE